MKVKFKWQKEYLAKNKKLTDEELFDKICFMNRSPGQGIGRAEFKEGCLIVLFKKRMRWKKKH